MCAFVREDYSSMSDPHAQLARRRTRQKITITLLATFLIAAGVLLIFVLKRAPLPLRIVGGLSNLVAGSILLLLVRQKFRGQ